MSEKNAIDKTIQNYELKSVSLRPVISRLEGELKVHREQQDDLLISPEGFLDVLRSLAEMDRESGAFLRLISSWIARVDKESDENRKEIRKLLGLRPDSPRQEVLDAIDDVAPLIADYRKRKRGT